ncbi:hypothetical protein [Bacillus thuringiensis]|uniref:hypothetical protein n=1 Tax=Bacillus thuringiensis TaxID=1428 RepID=UPI000211E27B|nr:hypothetical protein [Bacillus thuringiensis]
MTFDYEEEERDLSQLRPSDSSRSTGEPRTDCDLTTNCEVPFCCVVTLPHGFQYESRKQTKLVYDISCLTFAHEMCQRSINVDQCGTVDVDLQVLKIKGCVSLYINVPILPIREETMCTLHRQPTSLYTCCQDTLCVDHIVKCSVGSLPYYVLDGNHIQVCDLQVRPVSEVHPHVLQVSGRFEFLYT